jgi:GNAT superfamily N-acetyltransferase
VQSAYERVLDARAGGAHTRRVLWTRGPYLVSDERARLDLERVHAFLTASYWAPGIPREIVARSIEPSLAFGLYRTDAAPERQVGFARVITDRATLAYLSDVFVVEEERGRKLGRFLLECVHAHPELQGLRRWLLVTRDAQGLYRKLGWRVVPEPERHMEILRRDIYRT